MQALRRRQQLLAVGYAMQATHNLASPKCITKDELLRILKGNLKDFKLGRDDDMITQQVCCTLDWRSCYPMPVPSCTLMHGVACRLAQWQMQSCASRRQEWTPLRSRT